MLPRVFWLDPQEGPSPPILGSVRIPVGELAFRVNELPRRGEPVWIPDLGEPAQEAAEWLTANDREVELRQDFQFGGPEKGRLWSPNRFLEEVFPWVNRGTAVDLACGSGRDAVFLASEGLRVTAIDHLADATALGKTLCERYLNDETEVDWRCADLELELPTDRYDLATCFFYLDRDLLKHAFTLLKPGGQLVFETFTVINRERHAKPKSDRFLLLPGELPSLVAGLDIERFEEGWHDGRHTARLVARRPSSSE